MERASQKAILIGKGGNKIKHIGTDTRPEMEKLFKKKHIVVIHRERSSKDNFTNILNILKINSFIIFSLMLDYSIF